MSLKYAVLTVSKLSSSLSISSSSLRSCSHLPSYTFVSVQFWSVTIMCQFHFLCLWSQCVCWILSLVGDVYFYWRWFQLTKDALWVRSGACIRWSYKLFSHPSLYGEKLDMHSEEELDYIMTSSLGAFYRLAKEYIYLANYTRSFHSFKTDGNWKKIWDLVFRWEMNTNFVEEFIRFSYKRYPTHDVEIIKKLQIDWLKYWSQYFFYGI